MGLSDTVSEIIGRETQIFRTPLVFNAQWRMSASKFCTAGARFTKDCVKIMTKVTI